MKNKNRNVIISINPYVLNLVLVCIIQQFIFCYYFFPSLWGPLRFWIIPNWEFPNRKFWPLALQFCKAAQNQNLDWWMGIINSVWINIKTHTVQVVDLQARHEDRTMEPPESFPCLWETWKLYYL